MASSLPPPLREDATSRLPVPDGPVRPAPAPASEAVVVPPPAPRPRTRAPRAIVRLRAALIRRARRIVRRLSGYDVELAALHTQLVQTHDAASALREQHAAIATELQMERTQRELELSRLGNQHAASDHSVEVNRINLELLKGEVRSFEHTVEELGMAFAPATGLAGAGARFAELREAVNALERRLRDTHAVPAAEATQTRSDAGEPQTRSALFNYVGFERRFRGDPEQILADLTGKYADLLSAHEPVVDIGCGRAELLSSLAERGVAVIGVEPDAGMAAEARARGVTVHQTLAGDFLRSVDDHSLGSIIAVHVAEHLELDDLIEMIELSVRKLRPGGVFIAETPNPASLIVLGNSYIMDPTHVWPLHPSLLTFLCESAGFRDVRLWFYAPAESYHVGPVETDSDLPDVKAVVEQVNAVLEKLNHVLFGPQDYAVIATTPQQAE